MVGTRVTRVLLLLCLALFTVPLAFAQQTGSVRGRVLGVDGSALPGVTVEARSAVLPQPRVTLTDETGEYRLPALAPGRYTLTFSLAGMDTATRNVNVLLEQTADVSVTLGVAGVAESITVTAEASLVDPASTEISSGLTDEVLQQLPMRQDYRDLVKLIPGVQYTEDAIRGPSGGGSGQDNVYNFDGVNITLPLYGTLSSEPSSHDVEQISVIKGGAKAVDFNRAGGFTIDTVSKSGTSEFHGLVSYQLQSKSMTGEEKFSASTFEEDKAWAQVGVGGPILRDRLFFYGSYYRPTIGRDNRANEYGDVPDYASTRDEYFGKLTFTPISNILIHGSYRDSSRTVEGAGVTESTRAGTASEGEEAELTIGILEGSWILNNRSLATFKYTDFANKTLSRPDRLLGSLINTTPGTHLPINDLANQGLFVVPLPLASNVAGSAAFNAFIAPIVAQYGYGPAGARLGGGRVGVASTLSLDDFFRESWQVGYDMTLGSGLTHDLHFGYQWYKDEEELYRISNGWGRIEVPGGRVNFTPPGGTATPVYYQAIFEQMTLGTVIPSIHGEFQSENFEINDTIQWADWSFSVGALVSHDTWYGQGLKEDEDKLSGYTAAPGNRYKMYDVRFGKQIQPRLGVTWAYNSQDTVYASFARYNPAASSLPRAAAWDRNLAREIQANFDQNGVLIGVAPVLSSSGKLFVDDLDPRETDEYLVGTAQQLTPRWSARAYGRYRYSTNFWEDTNNNARIAFAPPAGVPRELYIPDLTAKLAQIGSGSSYVIAELDGAFTKHYEVSLESDYNVGNVFLRGSYTWGHYYGNFDQDNTTTANDASSFIGSSFIADGAGRQLWNNRYGNLRGDRRHLFKLYGFYSTPWNGTIGAYTIYQSGQPWEAWDVEPYRAFTTSLDDTARYAEPAGRHTTPDHYQLDVNYTQNVPIRGYNLQLAFDMFNVFDKQTGYNIQNKVHTANFATPRSYFDPRRYQVAARFQF